MTPETEGRLLTFLAEAQRDRREHNGQLDRVHKAIAELARKFDKFVDRVYHVEAELGRHDGRLLHVEDRVVRAEQAAHEVAENTGQHCIAELRAQVAAREAALAKVQESSTHWGRYALRTGIGILILLGTAVGGWLARGVF